MPDITDIIELLKARGWKHREVMRGVGVGGTTLYLIKQGKGKLPQVISPDALATSMQKSEDPEVIIEDLERGAAQSSAEENLALMAFQRTQDHPHKDYLQDVVASMTAQAAKKLEVGDHKVRGLERHAALIQVAIVMDAMTQQLIKSTGFPQRSWECIQDWNHGIIFQEEPKSPIDPRTLN